MPSRPQCCAGMTAMEQRPALIVKTAYLQSEWAEAQCWGWSLWKLRRHLVVGRPGAQQAPTSNLPQVHGARGTSPGAVCTVQGARQRQDGLCRVAALQHLILPQGAQWYAGCCATWLLLEGHDEERLCPTCGKLWQTSAEETAKEASPRLVPCPKVQGTLGVLGRHQVVAPQQAEGVRAAGIVLEGGQVRPGLHIPAQQWQPCCICRW